MENVSEDWIIQNRDALEMLHNGTFALKHHQCSKCETIHKPHSQQYHFDGLVAISHCSCGHSVLTLMGDPVFMKDAIEEFVA